jgi:protein phosphatase inhibitor 2
MFFSRFGPTNVVVDGRTGRSGPSLRVDYDIPDLHLGARASSPTNVSSRAESPTSMVASGPSSRRASLSSVGRNSSGRSGSATSSRSTSFNLPSDARGEIRAVSAEPGDEIEGEEMDEEGRVGFRCLVRVLIGDVCIAAEKHAAFVRARGRHYSNEAEAMKVCI